MRVYIAAPYAAREQVRGYTEELVRIGFTSSASWVKETLEIGSGTVGAATDLADGEAARLADVDLKDVERSDILVLITAAQADMIGGKGSSGGRHVETGYAMALGKPVIVVGEPEHLFHRLGRACTVVPNWHEALIELSSRLVTLTAASDITSAAVS
jgi:nucleoside 2-deoxyribosyltransferase